MNIRKYKFPAYQNSMEYFIFVSATVTPEHAATDQELKSIYHYVKLTCPSPMKESMFGTFCFRIQLTTSASKQDVYLVEDGHSNPIIIKGPYRDMRILSSCWTCRTRR